MTKTNILIEPIGYVIDRMIKDDGILKLGIRKLYQDNKADMELAANESTHKSFETVAKVKHAHLLAIKKRLNDQHKLILARELQIEDAINKLEEQADVFAEGDDHEDALPPGHWMAQSNDKERDYEG